MLHNLYNYGFTNSQTEIQDKKNPDVLFLTLCNQPYSNYLKVTDDFFKDKILIKSSH